MTCGGQLGAIQTQGTCWFYSILNGFILSEDGQKILFQKMKEFYEKLSAPDKAYFDDSLNAPCPMKNILKTKQIYFWKFIDQFLCVLSGPRAGSLATGRSAEMLKGMSLVGTLARKEGGVLGAHPQLEIVKILEHVGLKLKKDFMIADYDESTKRRKLAVDRRSKPKFVILKDTGTNYMNINTLSKFNDDKDYELMCSSIVIGNSMANKNELHKYHAVAGFTCGRKGYIYDSNQRKIFNCDYWSPEALKSVVGGPLANFYYFFKNGQINDWSFAFHIFARKEYVKEIAPSCRMRYRVKTPPGFNLTSPNLGKRINEGVYNNTLKPAERVALKRAWTRTEHRVPMYLNKTTYNSLINSASSMNNGIKKFMNLERAGYKARGNDYSNFVKRLGAKFRAKPKSLSPLSFNAVKFEIEHRPTKRSRQVFYSHVWRRLPAHQRKILAYYRDHGKWPESPLAEKPRKQSPLTEVSSVNKFRANFNVYWKSLAPKHHNIIRNYISKYKNTSTLNEAKKHVNGLKTAKARKEYRRERAVNMSQNNWIALNKYIRNANMSARLARSAKRAVR